jgi:hypothetical protein
MGTFLVQDAASGLVVASPERASAKLVPSGSSMLIGAATSNKMPLNISS